VDVRRIASVDEIPKTILVSPRTPSDDVGGLPPNSAFALPAKPISPPSAEFEYCVKLLPVTVAAIPKLDPVANALELDAYTTPPDVNDVKFVPPLAVGKVPVTPVVKGKPVKLVAVPLEGVPNAPLNNTGAPAEPVLTARAVAMPVPRPDTPVEIGSPVAFVKVALVGVPRIGVTRVGEVASTLLPVPVLVTETTFLLASNAKAVEAVKPDSVAVLDADRVVNAPAAAVVVPTGPLNESPTAPV
jgi:hypothetical protein